MIKYDACKLSDLIEKEYGLEEFNIPYAIMEDQRRIELPGVSPVQIDPSVIDEFKEKGYNMFAERVRAGEPSVLEDFADDLCYRGKLKAGDYLLCFDD